MSPRTAQRVVAIIVPLRPEARRFSQAGRRDVESQFRAERMVEALSAIYEEA